MARRKALLPRVDVAPSVLAPSAGVYETAGQPTVIVIFEDSRLFARVADGAWFRLYPASTTEYFALSNTTRWTFVSNPVGARELLTESGGVTVRRQRAQ